MTTSTTEAAALTTIQLSQIRREIERHGRENLAAMKTGKGLSEAMRSLFAFTTGLSILSPAAAQFAREALAEFQAANPI